MKKLVIIDYGAGNVKSVSYALGRLGIEPILSNDIEEIQSADKLILPGVGQAQFAMEQLKVKGLDELIPKLKQPLLGICLGMQLLGQFSEEGEVETLGIMDFHVKKLPSIGKVPQIGWNQIYDLKGALFQGIVEREYAYYLNSYYVPLNEYNIATTNYSVAISAAVQKDNFYGCQFHPEKSGEIGAKILQNFIENENYTCN